MPPSKNAPRRIKGAERRKDMLAARAEGKTFKAVAEQFGVSQRTVRRAIDLEFQRLTNERTELAEKLLEITVDRLDALIQAGWDQAMKGDLEAIKTCASVIERQAKLVGLGVEKKEPPQSRDFGVLVPITPEDRLRALLGPGVDIDKLRGPLPAPRLVLSQGPDGVTRIDEASNEEGEAPASPLPSTAPASLPVECLPQVPHDDVEGLL